MKSFFIIGLGRFGSAAAEGLYEMGHEVLVVDRDEELVRHIADKVTHAAIGDGTDIEVLKAAGAKECNCGIVAIGDDLAASVLATMNLKDLGVPYVVCKAKDESYKRALLRVGADRVLIPEKEIANRLVQSLGSNSVLDYIEFSEKFGLAEVAPPKAWIGKSLQNLDARRKFKVNVLGIKNSESGSYSMFPEPDYVLCAGDTLMVVGENDAISKLQKI